MLFSAPAVASGAYCFAGVVGALYYLHVPGSSSASGIVLSSNDSRWTLLIFLTASLATATGAIVYRAIVQAPRDATMRGSTARASSPPWPNIPRVLRPSRVLPTLTASTIPEAMLLISLGSRLLTRDTYLVARDHLAVLHQLGAVLALPAAAVASSVLFSATRLRHRVVAGGLLVLYAVTFFSLGSRALACLPLLLLLGTSVADSGAPRRLLMKTGIAAFFSFFLLQIPLTVRGLPTHGLLPYSAFVWHHPAQFASPSLRYLSQNILFSYPLTGAVALRVPHLALRTFTISINPLPGGAASWYAIAHTLRLNPYTPYSSLGELANHGWPFLVIYFLVAGAVLANFEEFHKRFAGRTRVLVKITTLALTTFFVLTTLQYNLRTATRVLYYGFILKVVVVGGTRLFLRRRQPLPSNQHG